VKNIKYVTGQLISGYVFCASVISTKIIQSTSRWPCRVATCRRVWKCVLCWSCINYRTTQSLQYNGL